MSWWTNSQIQTTH